MRKFNVSWSQQRDFSIPICRVEVSNDLGAVLGDYEMTFNDFAESIIDAELRELNAKTIVGHRTSTKKLSIHGVKRSTLIKERIETPIMNKGWIKYIRNDKTNRHIVVCEVQKQLWDMYYYKDKLQKVGHPRLLFIYQVEVSGRIQGMYCFGVQDKNITGETELFKYPYANVSFGKVCMGSNQLPQLTKLGQCVTMHNLFFGSQSTNCYYNESRNLSGITELRELYSKMESSEFPDEWLVSENITLDSFLTKF
ncbi:E2 family protein D [Paenibacillus sp. RU5A]|nr:E2 family protein D [Paenibacillus sp. RU5A]SOC74146.1 E2 family protein D [Paenibacillus sp. RU26A]SOC76296.1 E2 family protein D [Paenibacillus sp. RU5M]